MKDLKLTPIEEVLLLTYRQRRLHDFFHLGRSLCQLTSSSFGNVEVQEGVCYECTIKNVCSMAFRVCDQKMTFGEIEEDLWCCEDCEKKVRCFSQRRKLRESTFVEIDRVNSIASKFLLTREEITTLHDFSIRYCLLNWDQHPEATMFSCGAGKHVECQKCLLLPSCSALNNTCLYDLAFGYDHDTCTNCKNLCLKYFECEKQKKLCREEQDLKSIRLQIIAKGLQGNFSALCSAMTPNFHDKNVLCINAIHNSISEVLNLIEIKTNKEAERSKDSSVDENAPRRKRKTKT